MPETDPEALREDLITLPNADDGYSRVLFVGTTGAGKTSLLRQLIDSDPDKDRFPSTAPAKTTIADIEIVQSDGPYQAVVTFFTEIQIQTSIEECIADACSAAREEALDDKIIERFLNHRDQKFRLSYILGGWRNGTDDIDFDEETDAAIDRPEEGRIGPVERANRKLLQEILGRIMALSERAIERLASDLDTPKSLDLEGPEREAMDELIEEHFESYLMEDESFHALVHDVLEYVRERFDLIDGEKLERHRSGWPKRWSLETGDRRQFIGQIRWFASNDWRQFGRLLTPLVCGIRVKGPLFPAFIQSPPRLVLIDGQGLGHTPASTSSVPTHITKRFDRVDVILLVDSAPQPMQAAPLSVLRSVASSGHSAKLAVAFTHFDQVKGPNFQTFDDKRNFVMASVWNALSNLRDTLGVDVTRNIEHDIEERCFMLGGVDRNLKRLPKKAADFMRNELSKLVDLCGKAVLPHVRPPVPPMPPLGPIYDPTGITPAVRDAVSKFQGPWLARLGLGGFEGVREHWSRIKALTRRIAGELGDGYDTLRPVADLVATMTESVSRFLDKPTAWTRTPENDQERHAAIAGIRRVVSTEMHKLASQRLVEQHLEEWRAAYGLRGRGSAGERAWKIRDIYDEATSLSEMPPPSEQFLAEVRGIVTGAIDSSGGEMRLTEGC